MMLFDSSLRLGLIFVCVLLENVFGYSCPPVPLDSPVVKTFSDVYNNTCYLFVDKEEYWGDARSHCYSLGGEMLTITNSLTMAYIRDKLNSKDINWSRNGVWLGLTEKRGTWRWTNGEEMIYSNWAKNEPSRFLGIFKMEKCAQMRREDNWQWHDKFCAKYKYHYNYICQFHMKEENDNHTEPIWDMDGMQSDAAAPMVDIEKDSTDMKEENENHAEPIWDMDGMQSDAAAAPMVDIEKESTDSPFSSNNKQSQSKLVEYLKNITKVSKPDSAFYETVGKMVYDLIVKSQHGSLPSPFPPDTALNQPGDSLGKISPNAGAQETDLGYTTILIVVISVGAGVLLVVLVVFLVTCRLARQGRRKVPETTITYHNNEYSEPRHGGPPRHREVPALPPYRPPSVVEGVYFTPTDGSEGYTDLNQYAQVNPNGPQAPPQVSSAGDPCLCRDPLVEAAGSCSSLSSGAVLGACGGAESEGSNADITQPLLPGNNSRPGIEGRQATANGCSCPSGQDGYMDMRSLSSNENILHAVNGPPKNVYKNVVKDQHIYTNPLQEVGDSYSLPSKNVDEENAYSEMTNNTKDVHRSKNENKDQHTYSNVDQRDEAVENHYEVLP